MSDDHDDEGFVLDTITITRQLDTDGEPIVGIAWNDEALYYDLCAMLDIARDTIHQVHRPDRPDDED